MKVDQVVRVLDGDAWIEYSGNLYEYICEQDGRHLFSDVNDAYPVLISDKALRYSTEIYFTEKY